MDVNVRIRGQAVTEQMRAYIEYRLFCDLVPYSDDVASVHVQIANTRRAAAAAVVYCRALATLHDGGVFEAIGSASYLYAAVDRAARQLGALVARAASSRPPAAHGAVRPDAPNEEDLA